MTFYCFHDAFQFIKIQMFSSKRIFTQVKKTFSGSNYGFLFVFNSQSDGLEEDQKVVFTLTKVRLGTSSISMDLYIIFHNFTAL